MYIRIKKIRRASFSIPILFLGAINVFGTSKCVTENETSGTSAKSLFKKHCAHCHGTNGRMSFGAVPRLSKSKLVREEIARQIKHGGKSMPAFKSALGAHEIRLLSNYILQLRDN